MRTEYTVNVVSLVPDFSFRSSLRNLMRSIERRRRCGLEIVVQVEIIRVEPISTNLERWKAPTSVVGGMASLSRSLGFPFFAPDSGEVG